MSEHDELLKKAVADRDARPWRYYRLEHEQMKKFCEQLADQRDAALAEVESQRAALARLRERLDALEVIGTIEYPHGSGFHPSVVRWAEVRACLAALGDQPNQ